MSQSRSSQPKSGSSQSKSGSSQPSLPSRALKKATTDLSDCVGKLQKAVDDFETDKQSLVELVANRPRLPESLNRIYLARLKNLNEENLKLRNHVEAAKARLAAEVEEFSKKYNVTGPSSIIPPTLEEAWDAMSTADLAIIEADMHFHAADPEIKTCTRCHREKCLACNNTHMCALIHDCPDNPESSTFAHPDIGFRDFLFELTNPLAFRAWHQRNFGYPTPLAEVVPLLPHESSRGLVKFARAGVIQDLPPTPYQPRFPLLAMLGFLLANIQLKGKPPVARPSRYWETAIGGIAQYQNVRLAPYDWHVVRQRVFDFGACRVRVQYLVLMSLILVMYTLVEFGILALKGMDHLIFEPHVLIPEIWYGIKMCWNSPISRFFGGEKDGAEEEEEEGESEHTYLSYW
ncbi:hypothetical protein BCR34DRAFT_604051 [Clohesyomyces aquaticus]|uniref:Uncharacterized protein n=1 Tax=Clohesyomyces aquaticus TaxID=1231657 RepID=A0A1Y1Z9C4_9PLEO|nr:hypothetical protein BCR34DRAFT_604051 [Clohesyomyces aquaticus]